MEALGSLGARRDGTAVLIAFAGVALAAVVADHLSTPFDDAFDSIGAQRGVDPNLLRALARVESSFNPSAVGAKNNNGTRDYGLLQVNETTARAMGVKPESLVGDVRAAVDLACRVLLDARRALGPKHDSVQELVSAYNAGPHAVVYHGIVNETYVSRVMYHHTLYSIGRLFA